MDKKTNSLSEKKLTKIMRDYHCDDKLSKMIDRYEPEELSLNELDYVFAASAAPDYQKFLEQLNNKK